MPHQCLDCGETFREGSVEILDGCPECDGTRFFHTDESLDEEEREDLRHETKQTVREAVEEALEEPRDTDVWSWERREEWLRLEPDEAREILHDVVEDADNIDDAEDLDQAIPSAGDLPDDAPDPDDGTTLSFPDSPPDLEAPAGEGEETPDGSGTDPDEPADRVPEVPTEVPAEARDAGPDTEPDTGSDDADEDRITPAQLANEARPGRDRDEPQTDAEPDPATEEAAGPEPDPDDDGPPPGPEPGPPPGIETDSPDTEPLETEPEAPPEPDANPNPDSSQLREAVAAEEAEAADGRVSTVNVEEPGRYDIDVEGLLDTSPVIVEKDGHYMVHLPSIFSAVDEDEALR